VDAAKLLSVGSRLGSAEQSNTSLIFDELAILKLFRQLRPGENPDVEITRFLTEVAHFQNIPAYLGDLHRAEDKTTLAFLQAFAPNEGDGWAWTLDELAGYLESTATCPPPETVGTPPSIDREPEPPVAQACEHAGLYIDAVHLLGRRTAEMHLALATPTTDPAFAAEVFSEKDLEEERMRIRRQAETAFDALQRSVDGPGQTLSSSAMEQARELLSKRSAIEVHIRALDGNSEHFGCRTRIHGDYHLGQLLRARTDFLIVDFEGEPARSLEERRLKQPALRDVAGMLRSFSYAVYTAQGRHAQRRPEHSAALQPWAALWENAIASSFLRGYLQTAMGHAILPRPKEAQTLLRGLLLGKVLYELEYELNNRPSWVNIPLAGLLQMLQ
jgi:maltose alpha-D-glucosyltransferase/alpha-amylase